MFDFGVVAAAALDRAETLIPELLPGGHRSGAEWVCGDLSGGPGRSMSINVHTGAWSDFANSDLKGGDIVSLIAAQRGLSQSAACEALAAELGLTNGAAGPAAISAPRGRRKATENPAGPVPEGQEPPPGHGQTGLWWYQNAAGERIFAITRLDGPDGKSFRQWTWRSGKWHPTAHPKPRPLYRLPELLARPTAAVLIVEGEKAAEAAAAALPQYAVTTWAGGAMATGTVDLDPLDGRDVTIWPDADEPGSAAGAEIAKVLLRSGAKVSIVKASGQPQGWDVADAIADGMDTQALLAWIEDHSRVIELPRAQAHANVGRVRDGKSPVDQQGDSTVMSWQAMGLECNSGGVPQATIGNASLILSQHPAFSGRIWFDDFRGKIMLNAESGTRPWNDADDLEVVSFITNHVKLSKIGLQTAVHGVQLTAFRNRRNSVTDYLNSLAWDGTERLTQWVADYLGCPNTPYTQAVGKNWLVSMVARAFRPGVQADHMPVLEGTSGRGKSSTLAILGGEWYRAAPQAFGSKEFFEVIQGAWLVEIPDMVGFGRREHSQIISAITTRFDSYRASYGRHAEDHPRTVIFVATSETDEYLQDSRGIRRYWPLRCAEINLEALAAQRDQLFAEATVAFKAGATWHEMPAGETSQEQAERQEADVWTERIGDKLVARSWTTIDEVVTDILQIDAARQDRQVQMRIAKCLKALGFACKVERNGKRLKRIYRR